MFVDCHSWEIWLLLLLQLLLLLFLLNPVVQARFKKAMMIAGGVRKSVLVIRVVFNKKSDKALVGF